MAVEVQRSWVVRTPVAGYSGLTLGVEFYKGKAVVDDEETARRLRDDFGYIIEGAPLPARSTATRRLSDIDREVTGTGGDRSGTQSVPFFPEPADLPPGADRDLAIPTTSGERVRGPDGRYQPVTKPHAAHRDQENASGE